MNTAFLQFNHLERQARKLPKPVQVGVWCESPNGPRFITTEKEGVLAWEVCEEGLRPSKLGLRFCPVHLSPDDIKQPAQPNYS